VLGTGLILKPLMVIVTMVNDLVRLRSTLEMHGHKETTVYVFRDFLLAISLCLKSTLLRTLHWLIMADCLCNVG